MNTQVSIAGACAQASLDAGPASDIVVRLDNAGFIIDASPNAQRLGIDLETQLLMPHIADFAILSHREKVAHYFVRVIAGECADVAAGEKARETIEFPVAIESEAENSGDAQDEALAWYSLELTCLYADGEEREGDLAAIGTLRSIEPSAASPRHSLDGSSSDPFTGLADRRSFVSALIGGIAMHDTVSIAVFAIDGMRSIYMQYGQGTADEIRWGFARFLETMAEKHHILAQIDDERFGVILPGVRACEAREWAAGVLQIFEALAVPSTGCKPQFSASAGIARGELSAEWTIRQAELGLVMARAAGGMQTAICRRHSSLANGSIVKQAMDDVVERAARRMPG